MVHKIDKLKKKIYSWAQTDWIKREKQKKKPKNINWKFNVFIQRLNGRIKSNKIFRQRLELSKLE